MPFEDGSLRYEWELQDALKRYRPKARGLAVAIIETRSIPFGWGEWMAAALREVYLLELRALVRIEMRQLVGDLPQLYL